MGTPNPAVNTDARRRGFAKRGGRRLPYSLGFTSNPTMRRLSADPTLHFFCGKAGAGKTAVASHIAQDQNAILISEDIWLLRLFGDEMKTFEDYIRVSQKLKAVVGPLTVDLLNAGQSVVLDFQANTKTARGWFRSVFEQAGSAHVLHFLNTSDETCLERLARRNIQRPCDRAGGLRRRGPSGCYAEWGCGGFLPSVTSVMLLLC